MNTTVLTLEEQLRERRATKGRKALEQLNCTVLNQLREIDSHHLPVENLQDSAAAGVRVYEAWELIRKSVTKSFLEAYAQREVDEFVRDFARLREQVVALEQQTDN